MSTVSSGTLVHVILVNLYEHGEFRYTLPRSYSESIACQDMECYNLRHERLRDGWSAKWRRFACVAPLPVEGGGA